MSARGRFASTFRTHTLGELRAAHAGQAVRLSGAVDEVPGDGILMLRDGYGRTLVRLAAPAAEQAKAQIDTTRPTLETIVQVTGTVKPRPDGDRHADLETGEVFVEADSFEVLSLARDPLVYDFRDDSLPRAQRIRHRYLYLRKPAVQDVLRARTLALRALRRHLTGAGFEEVDTPILANRWGPEQGKAFLAVRAHGQMFALPGKRPLHGTLCMASGFDRVFEVARRFDRKERYGPYQQPEFTVVDASMAWTDEPGLHTAVDGVLDALWEAVVGERPDPPVVEMTHHEALLRYGTACPDARFSLEIADLAPAALELGSGRLQQAVAAGAALRAFAIPGAAGRAAELGDLAAAAGFAVGSGTGGAAASRALAVPLGGGDAAPAPGKDAVTLLGEGLLGLLGETLGAAPGDLAVVVLAPDRFRAAVAAGALRIHAARALGILEAAAGRHALCRITRLPYQSFDIAAGAWRTTGDPLTLPVAEELEDDPRALHGHGFYLALDGVNVGGGALRNHDVEAIRRLLAILGYEAEDVDARFGQLLGLLRYGIPPHGRFALGFDRLLTILLGLPSIDEVIPLPKLEDGSDPLARSPWPIDRGLVRGLLGV